MMENNLKKNQGEMVARWQGKTETTGILLKFFLIYRSLMNCIYSILIIFANKKSYIVKFQKEKIESFEIQNQVKNDV